MKNVLWIVTLIFLVTAGCAAFVSPPGGGYPGEVGGAYGVGQQDYGQSYGQGMGGEMDMDYTYNYLAPYGNWVEMHPYGYVWIPRNMGYRWRPYTEGHWVSTEYGWTFISNQEWGWIPFHYGRWGFDDRMGWYWVPGNTWAPAWVSWRSNDQYMGWAPIPPGINFQVGMDFGSLNINIPFQNWSFIGGSHFLDNDLYPYVLPYERNTTIINYTVINNNYGFRGDRFMNGGIGIDAVQRATRRQVQRYTLQDARQPGRTRIAGNDIQIYRPAFKNKAGDRPKTFLNRDQAQKELAPAIVFEPRDQRLQIKAEKIVRQRQLEEQKLLEQTQAEDLKAINLQRTEELRKVNVASDKAKIKKEFEAKKSELAKQHKDERQQMNKRHRTDTEQVKRTGQAKKVKK